MSEKAVFLDRDGTIIVEQDYLDDPQKVELLPGAARAVSELSSSGFQIVIVSNQSGVARGYFSMETVEAVNRKMLALLAQQGAGIDAVYICPHHPKGAVSQFAVNCDCRKPAIGMALKAQKELGLLLSESYMIGDKNSDVLFGEGFGAKASYIVRTGHGKEEIPLDGAIVCETIYEAAKDILYREMQYGEHGIKQG